MRIAGFAFASLLLAATVACSSPHDNPDQIRENTAKATQAVKEDTKAVADGIKEGLHSDSKSTSVDLNSATKGELMKLPGITDARADRIISARPYDEPHDLVTKGVLTRGEYDQISGRVTAKH